MKSKSLLILLILIDGQLVCDKSCAKCWGTAPDNCLECADAYAWYNGKCKLLFYREFSGYGRECVQCGPGNYATADYKCAACKYAAASCDQKNDLTCKTDLGYALSPEN